MKKPDLGIQVFGVRKVETIALLPLPHVGPKGIGIRHPTPAFIFNIWEKWVAWAGKAWAKKKKINSHEPPVPAFLQFAVTVSEVRGLDL